MHTLCRLEAFYSMKEAVAVTTVDVFARPNCHQVLSITIFMFLSQKKKADIAFREKSQGSKWDA